MKKNPFSKLNDKGASLIAVLVAIVVVGVMGSIVMQLTVTNLQMKEVERQSKKNFYSAEEFMGYLTNQINIQSASKLQESFNDMLAQYRTVSQSEVKLKAAFSKAYLRRMIDYYKDAQTPSQMKDAEDENVVVYEIGHYDIDVVKALIYGATSTAPDAIKNDTEKYGFEIDPDAAFYYADYGNATFTLGNICVFAKDKFGNKTKIHTDIVFHVPDINLDGSNVVKEFMKYSLIADDSIDLFSTGFYVDGNIYAGKGGIICGLNKAGRLTGKKIITRGDIVAHRSNEGKFYVGNPGDDPDNNNYSQIWLNNYVTVKEDGDDDSITQGAQLYISGDSFVADDLSVNGIHDHVAIKGNYYGYNFQENYGSLEQTKDAKYSSAILINGRKAFIDVSDTTSLMVAGRAFIGRTLNKNKDILLGESISIKANQIAYYVPYDCVDPLTKTIKLDEYEAYSGISNITEYVDDTQHVTPYYYIDSTNVENPNPVYYLNFKSDQAANDFFFDYYAEKKVTMMSKANNYIDNSIELKLEGGTTAMVSSLQIDSSNNPMIRGDYIYTYIDGGTVNYGERKVTISTLWGLGSTFYTFAQDHAIRYKSLILTLEDNLDPDMAGNVRLNETVEPKDPTLFNNLIDAGQWNGFFSAHRSDLVDDYIFIREWSDSIVPEETEESSDYFYAIVNNTGDHNVEYNVPTSYVGGLVIAAGDVRVSSSFRGTIIAGGTIHVSTSGESKIQADEVLISKMISRDAMLKNDAVFSMLFKGYSETAEEIMTGTSIEKYMTFDNWTKTME